MDSQKQLNQDRERIFRWIFIIVDQLKLIREGLGDLCGFVFQLVTILFFIAFVYFIGFSADLAIRNTLIITFRHILIVLAAARFLPEFMHLQFRGFLSATFRMVLLTAVLVVLYITLFRVRTGTLPAGFTGNGIVLASIFMIIVSQASHFFNMVSRIKIPPGMIFSAGFLVIITAGSGFLMLPNAHNGTLSYFDAFFTSVSAVCVTGLVVVDTSSVYTQLGQIIIMCLIQIGGLGIMTFTGFFSYIFTSGSTLQERILLKDFLSADSLGNLFKILMKIVLFTLIIELTGAAVILLSVSGEMPEKVFFSVFHSISAFCNAGFSTISGGLSSPLVGANTLLQTTIAGLIILGGIGFPVLLRLYAVIKHRLRSFMRKIQNKRQPVLLERFDIGNKLVLRTTLFLLVSGTILYYFLEADKSNYGLDPGQALFNSFFHSVTARTAGFNTVDLTKLGYPAVFLTILLMWIGASPGSTGGGIKTSTIAIALRAAWGVIRGRSVLEIHNREIGSETISRVLAIIIFSLIAIGTGFFITLLTEAGKDPAHLLYECVSAYCTVGLSIADTATFSQPGRLVLVFLMFTGRVGMITLLMAFFKTRDRRYHRCPEGEIYIN